MKEPKEKKETGNGSPSLAQDTRVHTARGAKRLRRGQHRDAEAPAHSAAQSFAYSSLLQQWWTQAKLFPRSTGTSSTSACSTGHFVSALVRAGQCAGFHCYVLLLHAKGTYLPACRGRRTGGGDGGMRYYCSHIQTGVTRTSTRRLLDRD